jgi:hypothetical protein
MKTIYKLLSNILNIKKCYYLITTLLLILISGCGESTTSTPPKQLTFQDKLTAIAGLTLVDRASPIAGYDYYAFTLKQPIDHDNPSLGHFPQRVRLLLKNATAPVVLRTSGYELSAKEDTRLTEITGSLAANQVEVEHRYYGESVPAPLDWDYLTIRQAAADHHQVIEALKPLLTGRWISTGVSKGGMTATYHHRFYPDDIAGSVAYVAPLSLAMWDERFTAYSLQVLDNECRQKYQTFQRNALLRKDELTEMLENWAQEIGVTVNGNGYSASDRLEIDIALSWITTASYFENMLCEHIPAVDAETIAYFDFLYQMSGFVYIADEGLIGWLPYHIQAAKELGNFSAPLEHLQDLLTLDVTDFQYNLLDVPLPAFQPEIMQDIYQWAEYEARNMIFIYGKQDMVTGGAYPIATDSSRDLQLHIEDGLHNIRITNLSAEAQAKIQEALQRWSSK